MAARKQVAMGIYKAPVVKTRYRKVVNHFHAKPKSQAPDDKITSSELNTNLNSSVILKKARYKTSNRTQRTAGHAKIENTPSRESE